MLSYYFKDLKNEKKLTNEETIELITNNQRDKAIKGNLRLVVYVLKRESFPITEDNLQIGNWGLCEAVKRFSAKKSTKFSPYAYKVIQSQLKRYARRTDSMISIPYTKVEKNEITEDMEKTANVISLDTKIRRKNPGEERLTLMDLQESKTSVIDEADHSFIIESLYNLFKKYEHLKNNKFERITKNTENKKALLKLTDIFMHRYVYCKTTEQVGIDLGVTKQAIFQKLSIMASIIKTEITKQYKYGLLEI